jgi:hypothetical protein
VKKILIAAIVVGTLLFLWSLSADAAQEGDYWNVERGDNLTLISKQVYGTIDKWTIIKDLNDIENPKLIYPGQRLRVIDLPAIKKNELAFNVTWEYMTKSFKKRRGQIYSAYHDRDNAYMYMEPLLKLSETTPTYQVKQQFEKTLALLEWVDLLDIAEAIKSNVGVHWHILLMAALGAQESGFRNVPGSHSELGPYQIKPKTALWLLSGEVPIQNESEARSLLDMPFNNTWMSYRILQKCGLTNDMNTLIPALQKYNAGSEKVKYSKQIKKRFDKLMKRYNTAVAKALR